MSQQPHVASRNDDIQILRAFAILFTLVLHLKVLLPTTNTFLMPLNYLDLSVGVDLFLVISGYVITRSILESTASYSGPNRVLIYSFWIKRVFRLVPAAWTWVVIACIAQLLVILVTDIEYDILDVFIRSLAALVNLMNVYIPFCVTTSGASCILDNYVGHYWSLSLEEQFYLVFPMLFFCFNRKLLVALLIFAILAQLTWFRPFFSYAWYFKTDALCWGILLALLGQSRIYKNYKPDLSKYIFYARFAGFALLVLLPAVGSKVQGIGFYMQPYGVAAIAFISAIIVWLASYGGQVFCMGNRYQKIMLYLGNRSYSLYLSHLVIYFATRDLFTLFGEELSQALEPNIISMALIAVALPITILSSEITYRLVENRFRPRGRLIAEKLVMNNS